MCILEPLGNHQDLQSQSLKKEEGNIPMMKLVMAIISSDDSRDVLEQLSQDGFTVTVTNSTGGYLRIGNTTIFCGVEEKNVEAVLTIFREHCSADSTKALPEVETGLANSVSARTEPSGRATIFVLDVDHFEQV